MKSFISGALKAVASGAAVCLLAAAGPAAAEIKVGVISSATGPGAAMGIPYRNAMALLPTEIGGEEVRYIFLDDASDPTQGVRSAQRLISEEKVDAIIGSNSMPVSLAIVEATSAAKTPFLVVSPTNLSGDGFHWSFPLPQPMDLMIKGLMADMKANKVRTVGYIGFTDSWGDIVLQSLQKQAEDAGVKVVGDERYARPDTSVMAQSLRLLSLNPDVVLVGASSSAAVLPVTTLRERGYKGQIYQTHGAVTADYIRLGGKSAEGSIAPTGPLALASLLGDDNPIKAKAIDLKNRYEEKYGENTFNPFVGYVWDAGELLNEAIPVALKSGAPGTVEFRSALRDAIEGVTELVGTQGVYTMTPQDHNGLDDRARVMIQVRDGRWQLLNQQ